MTALATHPKSRLPIEVDFDITLVCERCRRIQPLARSIDDYEKHFPGFPPHTYAGCLFCDHEYGSSALPGGTGVAATTTKTQAGVPIAAAHLSTPRGGRTR